MSWDSDREGLSYLLQLEAPAPSPEPHGRTGGEQQQVHVHTTESALEESEAN